MFMLMRKLLFLAIICGLFTQMNPINTTSRSVTLPRGIGYLKEIVIFGKPNWLDNPVTNQVTVQLQ